MENKFGNGTLVHSTNKQSLLSRFVIGIKSSLHSFIYFVEKNVLEPIAFNENFKYRVAGFDRRLSTMDYDGGHITNNAEVKMHDGHVFENRFQIGVYKMLRISKRWRSKLDGAHQQLNN